MKKIVYIDMDGVLVDFRSAFSKLPKKLQNIPEYKMKDIEGIFSLMDPMPGALESVEFLSQHFEIYFLSTAPWFNQSAWGDKNEWIKKYLPEIGVRRLILTHHKHLNVGDYLIDDRERNGAEKFCGEHIHFAHSGFENWEKVIHYLKEKENL